MRNNISIPHMVTLAILTIPRNFIETYREMQESDAPAPDEVQIEFANTMIDAMIAILSDVVIGKINRNEFLNNIIIRSVDVHGSFLAMLTDIQDGKTEHIATLASVIGASRADLARFIDMNQQSQ